MNQQCTNEHHIRGSGLQLRTSTLDGKVRVRRAIDAGNQWRDMMQDNNQDNCRKAGTGAPSHNSRAAPPVYTAEQRKTMRQGLRILAKIIARAHLRRQAAPTGTGAPGPPPE